MKKISIWGKQNKWYARFIIVFSNIVLLFIGLFTGTNLAELNITLPGVCMIVFVVSYFFSVYFYPSKDQKTPNNKLAFYIRQKSCDFILAFSAFCMCICLGNQLAQSSPKNPLFATVVIPHNNPTDSSIKLYKSIKDFSASMKDGKGNNLKWKERKKLLKEQVKLIKKSSELSDGGKVGLIVLSVLVALGLLFLIAALSCELSCSGADGAAVLVGIGGTALIIFLLVIVLKRISGKRKKIKQEAKMSEP